MSNNQKININVSEKDIIICICGKQSFIRTSRIAKVKNPIIGQKEIIVPYPPELFICASCGRTLEQIIKELNDANNRENESLEKA